MVLYRPVSTSYQNPSNWIDLWKGDLSPDIYSTAWVALIPEARNLHRPACPQALQYLRNHQLADGSWGEPNIAYAHERIVCTLAAIKALSEWQPNDIDIWHIERGIEALGMYVQNIAHEPHAPVGFELTVPYFLETLPRWIAEQINFGEWEEVRASYRRKLNLIHKLKPNVNEPRAWWFSLEILSEKQLAETDERLLNEHGSISTSVAATAAFLRAKRLVGIDLPQTMRYLDTLLKRGNNSVPFSYPVEVYERLWGLDILRRIGFSPDDPSLIPTINSIEQSWYMNETGLSSSDLFPVNDGDDTFVGLALLTWANRQPDDHYIIEKFWKEDHFTSYPDESDASVSMNIHALTALRLQPNFPHYEKAVALTKWLRRQMNSDTLFDDKWHISPIYTVAHAIPAFVGWDDELAAQCIDFLLRNQREDGGWGWFGKSTQEETAHAVIGLWEVYQNEADADLSPFMGAAYYLHRHAHILPVERMWIGKTLFCPIGVVQTLMNATHMVLQNLELE